jgi:hypothetical protein
MINQFEKGNIYLDENQTQLPLTLRNVQWKDMIRPLGMQGNEKKVIDILKDNKLSENEKNNTFVLEDSHKKIIAILGIAQSESTKITEKNKPFWVIAKNS